MTQRQHFKTKADREKAHKAWEEEIRQKAIQVIKVYRVTPSVERIWQQAHWLFGFSIPRKPVGLLFHSVLLPPQNRQVTIAIATTPALRLLKPFLAQIAKDLHLLLSNRPRVNLAAFDTLLGKNSGLSNNPKLEGDIQKPELVRLTPTQK